MLMMPSKPGVTDRKQVCVAGVGSSIIQQHHNPRNFAEEIEIVIEHSFDPGMQPVTAEEEVFLRGLAA
jgi:hypothetical protein